MVCAAKSSMDDGEESEGNVETVGNEGNEEEENQVGQPAPKS